MTSDRNGLIGNMGYLTEQSCTSSSNCRDKTYILQQAISAVYQCKPKKMFLI